MIAVRANATTGFISGKAAKSGLRVKPMARRAGTTSSSALQIVGVSNALRASSSCRSGRRGMAGSSEHQSSDPSLIGKNGDRQGLLRSDPSDAAANQQTKRNHQRQNDERDRKAAFGSAPSFPVGNPILHKRPAPRHPNSLAESR